MKYRSFFLRLSVDKKLKTIFWGKKVDDEKNLRGNFMICIEKVGGP